VIRKTPKQSWNNNRGQGTLFSIVLKDKDGGEIRGTFFKDLVDKWYDHISVDKVYSITGGRVKTASKQYGAGNGEYEITFDQTTKIEEENTTLDSVGITYDYKKLSAIKDLPTNTTIDVIAIVKQLDELSEISTKKGMSKRRRIQLCDDSRTEVELTLWGDQAESFPDDATGRVLSIKEARISEFRGKQLGALAASILNVNPTGPEADALASWWRSGGRDEQFENLLGGPGESGPTPLRLLRDINEKRLGMGTPEYFTCIGTLMQVPASRPLWYPACPKPECRNKKVEGSDGRYFCPNCKGQILVPKERFAFSFQLADFTGSGFVSALGDDGIGQAVIGYAAHEWAQETAQFDDAAVRSLVTKSFFRHLKVKARVKVDSFHGDERQKITALSVAPIDYGEVARLYAEEIRKYGK
jgi:replication factor A1